MKKPIVNRRNAGGRHKNPRPMAILSQTLGTQACRPVAVYAALAAFWAFFLAILPWAFFLAAILDAGVGAVARAAAAASGVATGAGAAGLQCKRQRKQTGDQGSEKFVHGKDL